MYPLLKRLRHIKTAHSYKPTLISPPLQDPGDSALGQHGDTWAQLQDVLRLKHRQGGGLHQHHEEAVRELSRHVSQVIITVPSEPLIGLQGVPEKTLSCQKAYNSQVLIFRLSPKSLGFCTCISEKSYFKRAIVTQNLRQESVFGTPCMV